ncbi:AbrB family transcriptional regulator [Sphingomonas abietis]|uniref:AbrB family transcriptional regulator n=1 Tax=Sphingomonas abietis TaxID=3012344 RepID=A0ABY7NSZ2_9SPHN|nr:AbrB family transcriptional regulator [Sphingomonas abietis]WBO23692.1 AbrB family transcriptional regulator [Sphingomonas abietis]
MKTASSIGILLPASCALAAALEWCGLPAGLLLGPMIAAIGLAASGGTLRLPPWLSAAAQAVIGLMIAQSLTLSILATAAHKPWIFVGSTLATLIVAVAIGWLLARWRVLPGSTAIWGSMPGAATAMVLIARDEGGDWQLVAVMTYIRVILVAALASLLAVIMTGHGGSHPPGGAWFPALAPIGLAATIGLGVLGVGGGRLLGLPAAALLGPMILGAVAGGTGLLHPELPGWVLAPAYLLVGWRIGLGFTPQIVKIAWRAAPQLLLAVGTLVLFCAGCGVVLSHVAGIDPLTAYLATSPGGADSVAIIASATPVDVSFVMSMQVIRFVVVLLVGPAIARRVARRFDRQQARSDAQGSIRL